MSWTSVHLDSNDDISPAISQIRGYVQVSLGATALMMPTVKAEELHAVLGELLAPDVDGGAS
jgi:hypothetical protein